MYCLHAGPILAHDPANEAWSMSLWLDKTDDRERRIERVRNRHAENLREIERYEG